MEWVKEQYLSAKNKEGVEFLEDSANKEEKIENKVILVAGRPLELEDQLQHKIYFDQAGVLTSKFGIQFVPAIVEQEGKELKIVEICINE